MTQAEQEQIDQAKAIMRDALVSMTDRVAYFLLNEYAPLKVRVDGLSYLMGRLGFKVDCEKVERAILLSKRRHDALPVASSIIRRPLGPELRQDMLERAKHACEMCKWSGDAPLHVHHIVPVSSGGDNDPGNLVVLCPNCHSTVHSKGWRSVSHEATSRHQLLVDLSLME